MESENNDAYFALHAAQGNASESVASSTNKTHVVMTNQWRGKTRDMMRKRFRRVTVTTRNV